MRTERGTEATGSALGRRDWLRLGVGVAACGMMGRTAGAAAPAAPAAKAASGAAAKAVAPGPLNRFPTMLQGYFTRRVREAEGRITRALGELRTRADAEAYVRSAREKIRQSFGQFPEKGPLAARVTGVLERGLYRVEKVIFESRPGFPVTANLYVPKGRDLPMPGVVGSCGHSTNGKAAEAYQSFAQGLARLGYVVLLFDPIGQGERFQYTDASLKPRYGPGVQEHLRAGNQQVLVGEAFCAWRAWDGIRALDYLLSRPEVDPKRVGVTGNSGGGTMTTWLCGVEDRWTMAAPSCFVTTFRRNFENELPADSEQYPPRALALGIDHADFLAAMAPKPVIILSQQFDFFDQRGTREAYERLRGIYRLLGAEDRIGLFTGPTVHGFSREPREAMYAWFNRAAGVPDANVEADLVIEKDADLLCTPRGQVADLGARTVFSFTRERSAALARARGGRPAPDGRALEREARALLKMPGCAGAPHVRILRPVGGRGYPGSRCALYAVETEPGIEAIVYRVGKEHHEAMPVSGGAAAILYVADMSSDAELREEPLVREVMREEPDAVLYACDPRGTGESQPDTCGLNTFLQPYGSDYFYSGHALMLDTPMAGLRAFDVMRVIGWLGSLGHPSIHLVASGRGTIPATFAALLEGGVRRVTLKGAPESYAAIAEAEDYTWPLSALLPGVLERFDLPDCYRVLEAKGLRRLDPRGA